MPFLALSRNNNDSFFSWLAMTMLLLLSLSSSSPASSSSTTVHAFVPTIKTRTAARRWSTAAGRDTSFLWMESPTTAGDDDAETPTVATNNDDDDLQRKKQLVRSTWKQVEESLGVEATKLFYARLFEQYPAVQPLFAHSNMDTQAQHLAETIHLAVDSLDDVPSLVPILQNLGARHATQYQTELPHYQAVGETLLWTLEQGLGPDVWTPQVADAWT